jgi:signal peptidase I
MQLKHVGLGRGSRYLLLLFSSMIYALLVLSLTMIPSFSYAEIPPVNSIFIVNSNSMSPNLHQYDTVVVDSHFPFNGLKIGDIIAFRTYGTTDTGQHEIIIHRVTQIVTDNSSQRIIRAKGDASNDSIPSLDYPIFQQNYIGKVIYVVPSGTNGGVGNNVTNNGSGNTGTNWKELCTKVSFALTSSCDTLVNPDNTLTSQGIHVRDCIQGGALLAGAALLLGTPPTTIVSVLPTVAQLGGCGDVVDFSKLSLGQLQGLGSIFR